MGTRFRRHRAIGAFAALLVTGAAACGGGGDGASPDRDEADSGPPACVEELLSIASRDDVVAAAQAGQAIPTDAKSRFDTVAAECQSAIDGLSEAELTELASSLDPAVLAMLTAPAPESFDQTADTISG